MLTGASSVTCLPPRGTQLLLNDPDLFVLGFHHIHKVLQLLLEVCRGLGGGGDPGLLQFPGQLLVLTIHDRTKHSKLQWNLFSRQQWNLSSVQYSEVSGLLMSNGLLQSGPWKVSFSITVKLGYSVCH